MVNIKYITRYTNERVAGVEPDMVSRFEWRATRRCKKLNSELRAARIPFYRWEVCKQDGKFAVVAFQNQAFANTGQFDE